MIRRRSPQQDGLGEGAPGASWRLMPLLEARVRTEAMRRDELGRALAALCEVVAEVERRRASLAPCEGVAAIRDVALGGELAAAGRFFDGIRRKAAQAEGRAREARAAAADASERLRKAREAREILERELQRWLAARRRTREYRMEQELDDLVARCRRSISER